MASVKGRQANTSTVTETVTESRSFAGTGRKEGGHKLRAASASAKSNEVDRHNLRFGLRELIAYHAMREQALARLSRLLTGVQVFLATSAIAAMTNTLPFGAVALTAISAFAGVVLLVIDPAGGAREHRSIRSRYHDILADVEEVGSEPSLLLTLRAKRERVAADSPPAYRCVQAIAFNAAINAIYPEDQAANHRYHVGFWRGFFRNWHPMRSVQFEREADRRRRCAAKKLHKRAHRKR